MPDRFDVTIVGGGLIGASFALLLAKRAQETGRQLKIAVVEQGAVLEQNEIPNQRVLALGAAATSVLKEIDIFRQLGPDSAHPYTKMHVWDYNTDAQLDFDAAEYGKAALGTMVDAQQCSLLLHAKLSADSQITPFFETEPKSLQQDSNGVMLKTDSRELKSRLLVAADGGNSWVRQQAKIFCHRQRFEQHGIVAKITTERSHCDTAWQRFLKGGPIAVLPLSENCSSIVWSAHSELADELMTLSEEDFQLRLADSLQQKLGSVKLLSKRLAFPLISQRADAYFEAKVVLIGDAAHSIHPLAGQGANLGFKDCLALVDAIIQEQAPDILGISGLQKYQRKRKIDNEQTDWLMTALHNAYQNDNPWWLLLRARGITWISKTPEASALLVKQAMGE